MTRPFDPTTGEPDPGFDPADYTDHPEWRDLPHVPEYEADKFPVGWDFLAAVVIAGACIAFGWWAFLR